MEEKAHSTKSEKEFDVIIHDINERLSSLFGIISNTERVKNKLIGCDLKEAEGTKDTPQPDSVYGELKWMLERISNANSQLDSINSELSKYL